MVAVAIVVVFGMLAMRTGQGLVDQDRSRISPAAEPSTLVLSEYQFPDVPGGTFEVWSAAQQRHPNEALEHPATVLDLPECQPMLDIGFHTGTAPGITRAATVQGDQAAVTYLAEVTKSPTSRYVETFKELLPSCAEFTVSLDVGDPGATYEFAMESYTPAGVDGKFSGLQILSQNADPGLDHYTAFYYLSGTVRDVTFAVEYTVGGSDPLPQQLAADVEAELVQMYNAQRTRINNAK